MPPARNPYPVAATFRLIALSALFVTLGSCASIMDEHRFARAPVDADAHRLAEGEARRALWVFTDEVQHPAAARRLLAFAHSRRLNTLYLSVYRPVRNAQGRNLYDERAIARFIRGAHALGIEVWAAYGTVSWHRYGCTEGTPPYRQLRELMAYNRANRRAAFDGIILDEEPPEPADLTALVRLYDDVLRLVRPSGLRVAATIRFFWDREVAGEDGSVKPAYQRLIDMDLDHTVVMAYRNTAGRSCPDDGIICLSEDKVRYATAQGRRGGIVVGLRTASVEADGEHRKTTFHGLPEMALQNEHRTLEEHFRGDAGYGGFALHQYRTAPRFSPKIYAGL